RSNHRDCDYFASLVVTVNIFVDLLKIEVFGFNLQQEIPQFFLPLKSEDNEPLVDLRSLLAQVYEQAGFDLAIDYSIEPVTVLNSEDKIWADTLLKEKELRSK
ncbi:MAG: DUF4058 family protein, partial [Cyanobacteria bacterium J06643_5]